WGRRWGGVGGGGAVFGGGEGKYEKTSGARGKKKRKKKIKDPANIDEPAHVVIEESKPRIRSEASNIFLSPGGVVIHADDFVPELEKTFTEMGTDKPGASGDQIPSHRFFL